MLARLALRNTRKSLGDFTVYFLTLMFGVAAFYAFGSVETQSALSSLHSMTAANLKTLGHSMEVVSVVVAIDLAFLVFYASGFLIRRRKREFGTYLVLGMPKRQVAAILLMETLLVGLLALGAGLALGVAASQGLSLLTAQLFKVDMTKFQFVFSSVSLAKTVGFFGLLFAVASVLNLLRFSRQTVSRLLIASKRREARVRSPFVSALMAAAGLALAVGACWALLETGLAKSLNGPDIWVEIGAGMLGTLLMFAGGAGLALRAAHAARRFYLRGLNPFVVRQVDNKISSTYVTMSIVCITMFFAITILSGGIISSRVLNEQTSTAYDASFIRFGSGAHPRSILRGIGDEGFDTKKYFAASHEFAIYDTQVVLADITGDRSDSKGLSNVPLEMIGQSDANALLRLQGNGVLDVATDGFAILFGQHLSEDTAVRAKYAKATLRISGSTLRAVSGGLIDARVDVVDSLLPVLVVPDKTVDRATPALTTLDVRYRGDGEAAEKAVLAAGLADTGHEDPSRPFDASSTSRSVIANTLLARVMVTYIGLYLGLILFVTSVAILALQQLSEAADNGDRYTTLSKIGASGKMMSRAVFTQVAVYFTAPLGLALVYSMVGGKAILDVIKRTAGVDVATEYGMATVILVLVFGAYFVATALAARRIALEK